MKNRIIIININDLIINRDDQAELLKKSCHREIPMRPMGICQVGENILISLEEISSDCVNNDEIYIFAPFDSVNIDEVASEISTRFFSGFSMLGAFDVKLDKWALFRFDKNAVISSDNNK